jgi:ribosomal protein L9
MIGFAKSYASVERSVSNMGPNKSEKLTAFCSVDGGSTWQDVVGVGTGGLAGKVILDEVNNMDRKISYSGNTVPNGFRYSIGGGPWQSALTSYYSVNTKELNNALKEQALNLSKTVVKNVFTPKQIFYNRAEKTTVVLWSDNSKTVSKAMDFDEWSEEMGFAACLMKKLYGSRSGYTKMLEKVTHRQLTKEERKQKDLEHKERKLKNTLERSFTVEIVKATPKFAWYKEEVGQYFDVIPWIENKNDYLVIDSETGESLELLIRKCDCVKLENSL